MTDFRDPRLHEALKAAPDDALRPAPQTRDAVLAQAHAAVAAPPVYVRGWRQAMALLGGSGRPWNAAFATLLVAGFVTVLWQGREVPPAVEPAPAVADVAAPAAVAVPQSATQSATERAVVGAEKRASARAPERAPERAPAAVAARKSANVAPPKESVAKDAVAEHAAPLAKAQTAEPIVEPARAPPAPAAAAPAAAQARARIADSAAFGAAAPVAESAWALPRWNRLRLTPSQAGVPWDRSQTTALAALLEGLLAASPVVPATASADVAAPLWRVELLQDAQPMGVVEVGRDTLRWMPAATAQDPRTVRPDAAALLALLDALAQLASR